MRLKIHSIYNTDFTDVFEGLSIRAVLRLVFDGIIVGIVAGTFASSFRWFLEYLADLRNIILHHTDVLWIIPWIITLALMGYIVHKILEWEPLSGGSGIPQIEGEMKGIFYMNGLRMLVAKYLGGALTSLGGFSVGREGPSIQLGGAAGKVISKYFKRNLREERILISAGAAAGLTSAFTAPISGAIFIFEEVHKSFFPLLLIPTFTASLAANYIASSVFGIQPTLGFTISNPMPIAYSGHLILLGIFIGIVGVIFNKSILWWKYIYRRLLIPKSIQMMLTLVAVGCVGYFSLDLIGGGNQLVPEISRGTIYTSLGFLAFLLIGKIILTSICYGSGAQGGIFLPILVIGASAGSLFYNTLLTLNLVPIGYHGNFVLAALGGIMASSMRVPLLSILLVLEMTQSFSNTYPLGIVSVTAYLVAELLHQAPIYDSLLAIMTPHVPSDIKEQTLFQAQVSVVSSFIGQTIADIQSKAPALTFIVSVERDGSKIVPENNLVINEQDYLYISCPMNKLEEAKEYFIQE